jgi:hypothetical protein
LEREARKIYIYGDGGPRKTFFAWMYCEDNGDIILCTFSECGAYLAGGLQERLWKKTGNRNARLKVVNICRVLAENPFAEVIANGPDAMNRLINDELKAKTAIELLNKLLDIIGEDALDIEPLQASD